jgi:MFS family permease
VTTNCRRRFLIAFTVSSALFGTIPGAMFAGALGDPFGRRDSLRVMVVLYILRAGLRPISRLVFAGPLSLHRPTRNRRLVGAGSDVYRRD